MASEAEVKVDMKKEEETEVDFAKLSQKEALNTLQTSTHGISTADAQARLKKYGPNKLPESTRIPLLVFLGYMWNPLSWAMEAAAIIAICLLDYADFALIVALLIVNSVISYIEESNADKAIKALTAGLAPKAKVLRDGEPKNIAATDLVPGDVIIMKFGDIVPADVKILAENGADEPSDDETPMQIDQAALTGESLPVKKLTGHVAFSGSAVKVGERHCVVYATGVNTFFGRAAALITSTNNVANLQKIMTKIGGICLVTIFVWVVIEVIVQFAHYGHACEAGEEMCPTLTNMLVVLVGGIPIAMPTVLSVTLALGAYKLAEEGAIVARMSAVEEMASMDVLCSDKTGTLTQNKLQIKVNDMLTISKLGLDVLQHCALSTNIVTEEPIDVALFEVYQNAKDLKNHYKTVKFFPFNPTDKYTCATIEEIATGKKFRIMKGSPQVVLKNAHNFDMIKDMVDSKMMEYAKGGYRSLGIARAEGDDSSDPKIKDPNDPKGEKMINKAHWEMLALIPMYDPPRVDTKETIERCHVKGIDVKMITGDHLAIGIETARMLGMGTELYSSKTLIKARQGDNASLQGKYKDVTEMCEKCDGFAEVFPEHKFEIVEILQKAGHICGMTGDGVNDAPALKKADVGIAVAGATAAAQGAADIVLTRDGLSAIISAVEGARKIFQRMVTYSKYTVAMTFRISFTFGLLTVIYDWYFPTILIVIMAVFNDGAMIALSKDRVEGSKTPNSWNLRNIFLSGIVYGLYLTLSTWALYQTAAKTDFFEKHIDGLFSLDDRFSSVSGWCRTEIAKMGMTGTEPLDMIPSYANQMHHAHRPINILEQCMTEQRYIRHSMLRSLIYLQVSVSGQALVFVVRNPRHSCLSKAGGLTYAAFLIAQILSTIIALFGFNGYVPPAHGFKDCQFCGLSTGGATPFFKGDVPITHTESEAVASVIGCTGYVIVAWIWSAIWYVLLDPIKWALLWVLNEDGFRDRASFVEEKKRLDEQIHHGDDKPMFVSAPGMVAATASNPLGRTSLMVPADKVMDLGRASLMVVKTGADGQNEIKPRVSNPLVNVSNSQSLKKLSKELNRRSRELGDHYKSAE